MERIVVLGNAGTGKSTFSRRLGQRTGRSWICLDVVANGRLNPELVPAFRTRVEEAHAGELWISDGNYAAATFDLRLPRATCLVWLEDSKWTSCLRTFRRTLNKGETHRLKDLGKVWRFIFQFDRVNRPLIESKIREFGPHLSIHHLRTGAEREEFVRRLTAL